MFLILWFGLTMHLQETMDREAQHVGDGGFNTSSPSFSESNLMHCINGYVYCNGPVYKLKTSQSVRWERRGSWVDMSVAV